jgi:hypothetical protein
LWLSQKRWQETEPVIHSEARELNSKIIEIGEEAGKKEMTIPVGQETERAAAHCGRSEASIKNKRKERKTTEEKGSGEKCVYGRLRKEIRGQKIPNFRPK